MSDEIESKDVKPTEEAQPNEQVQTAEQPKTEVPSTSEENNNDSERQPEQPKSEEHSGEKKGKYVPLPDLIKERQRRRKLEEKIEALERKINVSETPSKVQELMNDLDLDEDTAKKLAKHITPKQDELSGLQESFRQKAEDIASDYPDWFNLQQEMAEELNAVYARDPKAALSQSPEIYYLKAKARMSKDSESSRQEGARDAANKINSKNLASTESARNGSVKVNAKPKKFTKAWLQTLSQDDFVKYHKEINAELERGGFKE